MVTGQHHHVSPQYLHQYANHAAWLEDNRRNSKGENAADVLGNAMAHGVNPVWKGYWQRANGQDCLDGTSRRLHRPTKLNIKSCLVAFNSLFTISDRGEVNGVGVDDD